MESEQPLTGGNASGAVVRVGRTVRKQWSPSTPSVHDFMTHVRAAGIDVPGALGRDEQGRQVIEYVPGRLAIDMGRMFADELRGVGALIRKIHDASEAYSPDPSARWDTAIPAPGAELICHNDLAPWNLVLGDRWVFIDWDAAAPSTRLWDLAYAAQAFALPSDDVPARVAAPALRAFIGGYDADDEFRAALPEAMHRRAAAMLELLTTAHAEGREPWASMFADGHGSHWSSVVDYVATHREVWREALTR